MALTGLSLLPPTQRTNEENGRWTQTATGGRTVREAAVPLPPGQTAPRPGGVTASPFLIRVWPRRFRAGYGSACGRQACCTSPGGKGGSGRLHAGFAPSAPSPAPGSSFAPRRSWTSQVPPPRCSISPRGVRASWTPVSVPRERGAVPAAPQGVRLSIPDTEDVQQVFGRLDGRRPGSASLRRGSIA
jgi:hypothetical protein